jgi:hypothetical protein
MKPGATSNSVTSGEPQRAQRIRLTSFPESPMTAKETRGPIIFKAS